MKETTRSKLQSKLDTLADNGMEIVEVDKASFEEACQSVYEQYQDTYGEKLDEIRALLK